MSSQKGIGVQLQTRDLDILEGLFESRLLTLRHVAQLYFGGRSEAAKKRMQRLKYAGYTAERPRLRHAPSILYLAKEGFHVLQREGYLDRYPRIGWKAMERRASVSSSTVRHELEIADVKAAIHARVAGHPDISIGEFSTWPALTEFRVQIDKYGPPTLLKPDGFFQLEVGSRVHSFFLELDRSTEVLQTLINKAVGYSTYYRSGGLAVRQSANASAYREHPFRVLMICKSSARRDSAAPRLLHNEPPILGQVWLSTLAEVIESSFGAIWVQPVDYRGIQSDDHHPPPTDPQKHPLLLKSDSRSHEKAADVN